MKNSDRVSILPHNAQVFLEELIQASIRRHPELQMFCDLGDKAKWEPVRKRLEERAKQEGKKVLRKVPVKEKMSEQWRDGWEQAIGSAKRSTLPGDTLGCTGPTYLQGEQVYEVDAGKWAERKGIEIKSAGYLHKIHADPAIRTVFDDGEDLMRQHRSHVNRIMQVTDVIPRAPDGLYIKQKPEETTSLQELVAMSRDAELDECFTGFVNI
eukprot:gene6494-41_t